MRPARSALIVTTVALLAVATGCGEKKETTSVSKPERFNLMLDYFPNADHVGIYAAIADGDFRRAGLDVKPQTPSDPAAPLKLLAAGKTDLAISYEPELLLARDKGLKLVSVGAIVQKPLTSIISLGEKDITKPADLKDKKVGTAGIPYQAAYLETVLKQAKVNPDSLDEINVGFNLVPAMLSGKVDATLGAFWNYEGIELAQKGKDPNIIRIEQAGVPNYNELIFVARETDAKHNGPQIRRFLQAVSRGYAAARENPNKAVTQLIKANPDLKRKLQLASVKATIPVFFPAAKSRPFGYQNQQEWASYGEWMRDNNLLQGPPYAAKAVTNEFLPGEGL